MSAISAIRRRSRDDVERSSEPKRAIAKNSPRGGNAAANGELALPAAPVEGVAEIAKCALPTGANTARLLPHDCPKQAIILLPLGGYCALRPQMPLQEFHRIGGRFGANRRIIGHGVARRLGDAGAKAVRIKWL